MQIAALNRRAAERYGAFVGAMDLVAEALDSAGKLIDQVNESAEAGPWASVTQDELRGLRRLALEALGRLRSSAQGYEAELVSREWRF